MYLAVMLAMPGFCLGYGTPWRWAALAALGIVLAIKMGIEETAMAARHPDYAAYARTHEAHRSVHLVIARRGRSRRTAPMAADIVRLPDGDGAARDPRVRTWR